LRRLRKRVDCEAQQARGAAEPGGVAAATEVAHRVAPCKTHTVLCCELGDRVGEQQSPGTFAFESDFPHAPSCHHMAEQGRAYGGDLKFNRQGWFRGPELRADERAAQIPVEERKKITRGERTQWSFTKKIGLPEYPHAVRGVSVWDQGNGKEPVKILLTPHTHGDVTRGLRGYGQRGTGTETRPRDGQPHLGLGECPLRSGAGPTHHLSLVLLVPSLRVAQVRQGRVHAWAHAPLLTLGEAGRAVRRETLGKTITWAMERATLDNWQPERITAHLQLT
jgi:hypothetical protein